jgi:hypothetical protein
VYIAPRIERSPGHADLGSVLSSGLVAVVRQSQKKMISEGTNSLWPHCHGSLSSQTNVQHLKMTVRSIRKQAFDGEGSPQRTMISMPFTGLQSSSAAPALILGEPMCSLPMAQLLDRS